MRLEGKVALVTGSSQGIGKSIARKLLESGAVVILNARNKEKLIRTQQQLISLGAEVHAITADVSNWNECQRLIEEVIERFGRLDILVNNAGVVARGSIEDMTADVFRKVLDVNILGTIYPTKAALSYLRSSKGSVVSVSSIASFHGIPYNSVYCASKKALTAFADALRLEEEKNNLHVGIVYVGFTENDPEKTVIEADGREIYLEERKGVRKQSPDHVAGKVVKLIQKRRNSYTLSVAGRLLLFFSRIAPILIHVIYAHNLEKIRAIYSGEPRNLDKK